MAFHNSIPSSSPAVQLPAHQTAVVGTAEGGLAVSREAGMPSLEADDDAIIVRTAAVSVNPVDTKMTGAYTTPGAIAGCDFAGTVEAVGRAADGVLQRGDRVCGAVMGMNALQPAVGAFASFVGARASRVLKIPPAMDFAHAAALPTVCLTVGLALFNSLALPGDPRRPVPHPRHVLVYGGSTASGTAAIQLLRLSGFIVVATCSPANFDLVQSYGAAAVFDYRSPDCAAEIRAYTKNGLGYALDCITNPASMKLCYAAIGRAGGRYTALDPFPPAVAQSRSVVKPDWVLGPLMLGKDIAWPAPHGRPADEAIYAFGTEWFTILQELFDQDKIREHPLEIRHGGFEQVLDGVDIVRSKVLSGKKLVYTLDN